MTRRGDGVMSRSMNEEVVSLFAKNPDGTYVSSIATLFPRHKLLLNRPPMHWMQQCLVFPEWFRKQRETAGLTAPGKAKVDWESRECVDLVLDAGDVVLIRPELERMDLALAADELLQTVFKVPKHRVRFLSVHVPRVRQVLRERGELWRISTPPTDPPEVQRTIANCRVAIREAPLYYHSRLTGTRWLTFAGFDGLGGLEDAALARQLGEIAEFSVRRNRHGNPEVDFFAADVRQFGSPLFVGLAPATMGSADLRRRYAELLERFREATPAAFHQDRPRDEGWRDAMFKTITGSARDDQTTEVLLDPGAEQWLKIRWLPGGRFHKREFIFESVFPQPDSEPADEQLKPLWDPLARGFIANFIREYGDVEYLNLGRVETQRGTPPPHGARRGVYLAEVKVRGENHPRLLFLRLQRWGIRERLLEPDENRRLKDLVRAVFETEEYVDYTLDRRLACLQLGVRLPHRVHMRRVAERYPGPLAEYVGRYFPVIYYEREYLPGIPSNRISSAKLNDPAYACALARLLGQAAALNIVVGRTDTPNPATAPTVILFDEGDEVVVEGSDGLPREVVLTDHGGTFADYLTPSLLTFAEAYAAPLNRRWGQVQDPQEFAVIYLDAFRQEFEGLQNEYRRFPEAFDNLFKHLVNSPGGFADRWEQVLKLMNTTNATALVEAIRGFIKWPGDSPG